MSSFRVVQPIPNISGTPEYEAQRASILKEFASKVPQELHLPSTITDNPPKNVTKIPRECGILTSDELNITENYDAVALAHAIASKELTAVAVATAFAKRAIIAHQLTCCLTEWFIDEAIQRAKELDEHLEKTGKTVGPLHGVPISVKEHVPLAGHYSMMGFLDTRAKNESDCHMVSILRSAGAVFYCKTIQPQSIMHLESDSAYGRVLNPYNINLSAGGSSGGEAALIAMRGSPLGIGTDIGGSVRCPAGFCGIYGFKTTSYMLPMKGCMAGGFPAELNILGSCGPMSNSLRDLDLFVSVLLDAKPYLSDPRLVPIPWVGLKDPSTTITKPLKIGLMMHDGDITPQPPVTKALQWANSQLQKSTNVQVLPFSPYKTATAMQNIRLAYWPDNGVSLGSHLDKTGEPLLPLTKWVLEAAQNAAIKDKDGYLSELTATQVLQQRVARDQFRCEFAEHWEESGVDVVICPVFVGTACQHETAFYWNYTAFWNYVDCPGVVVPTPVRAGKKGEDGDVEVEYAQSKPLSERCEHVRQLWGQGDFEGAPVNLQIVARKYHDNELFAALSALQGVLGL